MSWQHSRSNYPVPQKEPSVCTVYWIIAFYGLIVLLKLVKELSNCYAINSKSDYSCFLKRWTPTDDVCVGCLLCGFSSALVTVSLPDKPLSRHRSNKPKGGGEGNIATASQTLHIFTLYAVKTHHLPIRLTLTEKRLSLAILPTSQEYCWFSRIIIDYIY